MQKAHERLFLASKTKPNNIIAMGYARVSCSTFFFKFPAFHDRGRRHELTNNFMHRPPGYTTGSSTQSSQLCMGQSGNFCCRGNTFSIRHQTNIEGVLRIGADAVLHLLFKTSLFISLPNECLCQLTGEPIIFASLPPGDEFLDGGPHDRVQKRKREASRQLQPRKRPRLIKMTTDSRARILEPPTNRDFSQPMQR